MGGKKPNIPKFSLYGEPPDEVHFDFLHIETIKDRSEALYGDIKPHLHSNLCHIFIISGGNGKVKLDIKEYDFSGQTIVFVPAISVHGFNFEPNVDGYVLTIAQSMFEKVLLGKENLKSHFINGFVIENFLNFDETLNWLERIKKEINYQNFEQNLSCEINLIGLFLEIARSEQAQNNAKLQHKLGLQILYDNFTKLIEAEYSKNHSLEFYVNKLKITTTQLRYACKKMGMGTPNNAILNRKTLEAKRLLIYSDISISQIANYCGFEDAAYFSRLFTAREKLSPAKYRLFHRNKMQN